MNKLLAISVLGLVLGFSNSSYAVNFVDTNANTKESQQVSTDITGGRVETSSMSFYFDPAQRVTGLKQSVKTAKYDETTLLIFGVRL